MAAVAAMGRDTLAGRPIRRDRFAWVEVAAVAAGRSRKERSSPRKEALAVSFRPQPFAQLSLPKASGKLLILQRTNN